MYETSLTMYKLISRDYLQIGSKEKVSLTLHKIRQGMYFAKKTKLWRKSGLEQTKSSRAYLYLLKTKNQSQKRVSLALYKISVNGLN